MWDNISEKWIPLKLLKHTEINPSCAETKTLDMVKSLVLVRISMGFMIWLMIFKCNWERFMSFSCHPDTNYVFLGFSGSYVIPNNQDVSLSWGFCLLLDMRHSVENSPPSDMSTASRPWRWRRTWPARPAAPPPSWLTGFWAHRSGPGAQRSDPAGQLFHRPVFFWPFPVPDESSLPSLSVL